MTTARQALMTGVGWGVGLMYFLDPERGAARRARARDQLTHAAHRSSDALHVVRRDLSHRTSGAKARIRSTMNHQPIDNRVLVERVRAQLGRVVSYPHAIEVDATAGVVRLRGPIFLDEAARAVKATRAVAGVKEVVNQLDPHPNPTAIPTPQRDSEPKRLQLEIWQSSWSPALRLIAGMTGTALAGYGAARRDRQGAMLAATGLGLFARAATNLELRRLTGIGAHRRAVDIQKTITIDAPVEHVFAFWTLYENFALFMSHVLDVRPGSRDGQSHWTVVGPFGTPVEFDTEVSACVLNQAFAWRTIGRSTVEHAGIVQFEPTPEDRTRVQIRMSYNPPGGWVGHSIAKAFGVDPKSSFDADLVRMKTLLETGQLPHDARKRIVDCAT
jgi:uncharacterized membrane protein